MTRHDQSSFNTMPAHAPLAMPDQDLSAGFTDKNAPGPSPLPGTGFYRWATFIPAIFTTASLIAIFADWFKRDGYIAVELAMIALVGFSAFWIALSVAASTIGLLAARRFKSANSAGAVKGQKIALLVPVYNEDPDHVFRKLTAMRRQLNALPTPHEFAFFVLSDTRCDAIAQKEATLTRLQLGLNLPAVPVYYRRRAENTDRKTGNIRNWIENWGADWDGFITLDADSTLSAKTINTLSHALSTSPDTALVQTVPALVGARTLFARTQQFANNTYGRVLASGLDRWSGTEGNYWGHNAILRTRAFAACAGLPHLRGKGALSGTIKSHDFVEAALLRRAGWAVRLIPHLNDSYEETPQNIIQYVERDRRWCQGNLQHLRLIATPGLAWASRFHMLQGAMAYIASVAWFGLLVLWALMGRSEEQNVIRYFTDSNPLFPQWPQMDVVNRFVVLIFMLILLLAPKIFGLIGHLVRDPACRSLGGRTHLLISFLAEVLLSFVLAPILMVQHVIAVIRTLLGYDTGWSPQNRNSENQPLWVLARFHWLETVTGLLLLAGIDAGIITLWLLPIAFALAAAVPISHLSGKMMSPLINVMKTREQIHPSPLIDDVYGHGDESAVDAPGVDHLSPGHS